MSLVRNYRDQLEAAGRLLQLSPDVDPEAPVNVVRVVPRFAGQNPLVLRKVKNFPTEIKNAVLRAFSIDGGVLNEATGMRIGMSGKDFKEHFKIDQNEDALAHLEAIAALPELLRTARRIETHTDNSENADGRLKAVHRFISAFGVGDRDYSVLLTVKEWADGNWTLDTENPVRLYHHRVEKQLPPTSSTSSAIEPHAPSTSSGVNSYTIRELAQGVNDSEGNPYFEQPAFHGSPKRGIESMSADFIGTGEGAQAFGWGLYFTESRGIGEGYRKSLSSGVAYRLGDDGVYTYGGDSAENWVWHPDDGGDPIAVDDSSTADYTALKALRDAGYGREEAIVEIRAKVEYGELDAGFAEDARRRVEEKGYEMMGCVMDAEENCIH
ncbi:MAG: hypothetical protein LBN96_02310 [Desulfovibrio sp.]|jgi:hypothetical protein|nr:hypothetical protein [Desulfovibrio sp.]